MDVEQIPNVVQLNIRGRFRTTLLSILTKDTGSKLAAMFTGQLPIFKDADNRYFIDAEPNAFEQILLYLRDGSLPDIIDGQTTGFGGGFGGGFGRGLFENNVRCNDLQQLYKEAQYFELEELVGKLEDYRPILFEKKLKDFRKSTGSYEECLTRILEAITGEEILYGMNLVIQLRQDSQTIDEPKCCDHKCIDDSSRSFGQSQSSWETDTVVKIPAKVDIPLFKLLYTDLIHLGYRVEGRLAICHFRCNKKSKKACAGFGFHPDIYCCMEKLYLLKFQLANTPAENLTPYTRVKSGAVFGQAASGFGSAAAQQQAPQQSSLFGSSKVDQQNQQQQGFGFGSGVVKQTKFQLSPQQQQSSSGFSFGGQPSIGSLNHQGQSPGGFSFGSVPALGQQATPVAKPTGAFGGFGTFGSAPSGQGGGLFGSPTQQNKSQFGNQGNGGLFDQAPAVTAGQSAFGQTKGLFGGGFQINKNQNTANSDSDAS